MPASTNTDASTKRPGGRRKSSGTTRDAILKAAVEVFAESGYGGATLRSITDRAGVDVAMVRHFFGGKQGLFDEAVLQRSQQAMQLLFNSQFQGRNAADLLGDYFAMWEDPATAKVVRALFLSALESEERRAELQAMIAARVSGVIQQLAEQNAATDTTTSKRSAADQSSHVLRTQLIAAHLLGVGLARYIMQIPPLATTSRSDLVTQLTPVIEVYLAG